MGITRAWDSVEQSCNEQRRRCELARVRWIGGVGSFGENSTSVGEDRDGYGLKENSGGGLQIFAES